MASFEGIRLGVFTAFPDASGKRCLPFGRLGHFQRESTYELLKSVSMHWRAHYMGVPEELARLASQSTDVRKRKRRTTGNHFNCAHVRILACSQ